ncbi:Uncharacterised protein [Mycobacteroides abscessus subsp. massiliense]|nr:Uncharacterised protein [Mycobacteroides abscessus]SHQ47088.1 Uncharacterised protein [Mycobacteroides abscessus subsp. abscessus]SKG55951.1 Uncharacterised protein [Mycobacteroides abscessus subsp. massiliense]CPX00175.1 Uncharacterised protein [Mycobacteroides abscessus]SHS49012.1 Uncharacterised protein [Mycobacteroides abscessus subsp. abscessus]
MTASGPLYAAISAGTVTDTRVPAPGAEVSSTRMFLARPRFTTTTTMYVDVTC